MTFQAHLEQIFNRPFKDDGENLSARCPLHEEKTPSFYVHKDYLIYNCFGCKASGKLINLIKEYKEVDEEDASRLLGISLEDIISASFNAILPTKPEFYPESWLAPFTKGIHRYVIKRGFKEATLIAAGSVYDNHRGRQVFPHRDREGHLVGAIGRACKEQEPRWYFYWGYEKGRYLYRPGNRRNDMATLDSEFESPCWVVEGVFDALWLYQHGYNAVATLGSKPTYHQIEELKDYSTLVLAYDNDQAGQIGVEYIYKKLRRHATCLYPMWPKENIDVMDIDPKNLTLHNVVERELIPTSKRSSRVLS